MKANTVKKPEPTTMHLYVVDYKHLGQQYRTVVESADMEAARRQFRRDHPHVELLACC